MGKKITIGLLFHSFCSSNLGVGALALSQCRIIESICSELNIEVEILSYESNINDKYTDCTNLNIILKKSSLSPFVMIKSLKQCDLIIDATGGDSFADIYGMKNFVAIMMIKYYSIFSGVPIILSPQTIGPFNKRISKIVSNIYLRFVKMIFLRDELSISSIPKYCNFI